MPSLLRRLYDPAYMISPEKKVGEIPSAKSMYQSTLQMAWPSMTESFLVAMVSIVDTIMVGGLGSYAIAAVGITNQPRFIVLAAFMALNTGIVAVVARRKGQNDPAGANRALRQCLLIGLSLSIVLSAIAILFARPMLLFAGAQPDTIDPAVTYFRIMLLGVPATVVSLCINAAQRGAGNTKISMTTNITANLVNCLFNWLLINGNLGFPAWGIAGAAAATALGNYVAMFMSIYSVLRKGRFLHLTIKDSYIPDKNTMASILKISSSSALEQVFVRIGFFIYVMIVAKLGTDEYATHQICMNVLTLSFCFGDGMTVAASALVGQNLGRKRPDLSLLYCKCTQRIGIIVSIILTLIFTIFAEPILRLFSEDPYILDLGSDIMIFVGFIVIGQIAQVIYSGCLRGAGDTMFTAVSSMISIAIVRPLLSYVLCYPLGFGIYGAWWGVLIDQYLRLALNGWRFGTGKWTKIEV